MQLTEDWVNDVLENTKIEIKSDINHYNKRMTLYVTFDKMFILEEDGGRLMFCGKDLDDAIRFYNSNLYTRDD